MTTVAARDGVMACDSRVSGSFPGTSKKIRRGKDFIIGFSGDWTAAIHMMDCYIRGTEPTRDKDDVDFLILRPNGIFYMDAMFREVKVKEKYYAIGSGEQAAMVAMNMGADAREAVRQAIKVDNSSGGRVYALEL